MNCYSGWNEFLMNIVYKKKVERFYNDFIFKKKNDWKINFLGNVPVVTFCKKLYKFMNCIKEASLKSIKIIYSLNTYTQQNIFTQ